MEDAKLCAVKDDGSLGEDAINDAAKKTTDDDFDASFQRHLVTAERAKSEYKRLYREMVEQLRTEHLEPINQVLLEHEKVTIVDQDEALRTLKEGLLSQLLNSLDVSWETFDINNSIASLEMLKERYKQFENHDWKAPDLTPEERSLAVSIRYKQMCKKYLEKQIEQQNKKLEELMNITSENRDRMNEISKRRIILRETMERKLKEQEQLKQEIQHLTE